jgi:hypothetical protein
VDAEQDSKDDPLLHLFQRVREALRPLGIQVDPLVLMLWRDSHASGRGLFTQAGLFSPEVTVRIAELARDLAENTADPPSGEQRPS